MLERAERQVKQSPLKAMLSFNKPEKEEKEEAKDKAETKERVSQPKQEPKKKKNDRAYLRYRGKSETGQETKAMSYYVTDDLIKAIEIRKSRGIVGERDRSAIVRAALTNYLEQELKLL